MASARRVLYRDVVTSQRQVEMFARLLRGFQPVAAREAVSP